MDRNLAILAVEAAEIAYSDELDIADTYKHYEYIDIGGVQGFVAKVGKTIIVSFRGTDDIWDWIVNLNASKVKPVGMSGKVHEGFYRAMLLVSDECLAATFKMAQHGHADEIVITGHSQGAAIALLYAARIFHGIGKAKPVIHLFGCPRVGNKKFAKWYDSHFDKCYRWVKNNDIVTRCPFRLWSWIFKAVPFLRFLPVGFRHVGQLYYLDHNGDLQRNISRFRLFKDRLAGRILHVGEAMTDGVADHSRQGYCKDVTKNMRDRT